MKTWFPNFAFKCNLYRYKQVANIRVNFEYNDAGYISVTSSITNMNVKWYTEHSDDNVGTYL